MSLTFSDSVHVLIVHDENQAVFKKRNYIFLCTLCFAQAIQHTCVTPDFAPFGFPTHRKTFKWHFVIWFILQQLPNSPL